MLPVVWVCVCHFLMRAEYFVRNIIKILPVGESCLSAGVQGESGFHPSVHPSERGVNLFIKLNFCFA